MTEKKLKSVLMIGGLLVGGVLLYQAKKKTEKFVTETINPASTNNVVYSLTKNDQGQGLGIRLYEWIHGDD